MLCTDVGYCNLFVVAECCQNDDVYLAYWQTNDLMILSDFSISMHFNTGTYKKKSNFTRLRVIGFNIDGKMDVLVVQVQAMMKAVYL
jgi:hypothetical protein